MDLSHQLVNLLLACTFRGAGKAERARLRTIVSGSSNLVEQLGLESVAGSTTLGFGALDARWSRNGGAISKRRTFILL